MFAHGGFLSRDECKAFFDRVVRATTGGGETFVTLVSHWSGSVEWARNRIYVAADRRTFDVLIKRSVRGATGIAASTRIDDEGIKEAVQGAEATLALGNESPELIQDPFIDEPILHPVLWSDSTYDFGPESRAELAQQLIDPAEAAGMMSAGALAVMADGHATISTQGMFRYYPTTSVECSMTVRNTKGSASGWAGVNHYDIGRIDPKALAVRALDKCVHSANPVAMEPGRYTVILEPQATAGLFAAVIDSAIGRIPAEQGMGPFAGPVLGTSKISEQVLDRRLVVSADPMDLEGGFLPYQPWDGTPFRPVAWIDQGILKELAYPKGYALQMLGHDKALPSSSSFRLAAAPGVPTVTIEEMIRKTERGLLITRFSGVRVVDVNSMLTSGYTRDGIWLIERGAITRPIKNLRFNESPLFALNKLEDVGPSVRIYRSGTSVLAPAIRVRDFCFTALADAV